MPSGLLPAPMGLESSRFLLARHRVRIKWWAKFVNIS